MDEELPEHGTGARALFSMFLLVAVVGFAAGLVAYSNVGWPSVGYTAADIAVNSSTMPSNLPPGMTKHMGYGANNWEFHGGVLVPAESGSSLLLALICSAIRRLPRRVGTRADSNMLPFAALNADYPLQHQAQAIGQFGSYQARVAFDATSHYSTWSAEMYRILGRRPQAAPATMERYLLSCVHPEDRAQLQEIWRRVIVHASSAAAEYRIIRPDGVQRHVFDYIECMRDEKNGGVLINGLLFDIAERKQVESERLEAATRYQALVERLGGIPYIASPDTVGTNIHVGPRIHQLLGFSVEQWCTDPELRLRQIHEDDRATLQDALALHLATGDPLSIDYRVYGADGTLRWVHDEARVVCGSDGSPLFLQGVLFDVTMHKNAQGELERSYRELKALIVALDAMRDEEQRRLAREMHDDLGQLLAAMKIDLSGLEQALPRHNDRVALQLERIHGLVDTMVCSVRRIIADLPPKDLDELGLFPALEQMKANFSSRYALPCTLELPTQAPLLSRKSASTVYRVVQEALNNVAKHACATQVCVRITQHSGRLEVAVADDGKGMTAGDELKSGSFGLVGMRERIAALGGRLRINRGAHSGTVILAEIPLTDNQCSIG